MGATATSIAMVKALARAFRWRKMLDASVYTTLVDLAKAKRIRKAYVSQILRLTLLAPEIIEASVDGRQPAGLQLGVLLKGFPLEQAQEDAGHWRARHAFEDLVSMNGIPFQPVTPRRGPRVPCMCRPSRTSTRHSSRSTLDLRLPFART
jgi:hypothetical protein